MKLLFVAGTFDASEGRGSGYVRHLVPPLLEELKPDEHIIVNGGHWKTIQDLMGFKGRTELWLNQYDVIFWWADVDNEMPKFVRQIKEFHPKCLLVTSKRNFEGVYSYLHLFARALSLKSNLFVEFTGARDRVEATVMDPLGNAFTMKETNIPIVAMALAKRVKELRSFHRISSEQVGYSGEEPPCPDQDRFFSLARHYADVFHHLVHAPSSGRFLGNLSFRCESGFPSFRDGHTIWVSKRNIDKRDIGAQGFVACSSSTDGRKVLYHNDVKPSVDTPVQLLLYDTFPNVRYMLHSHAYLDDAVFTKHVVPCGALEEQREILEVVRDPRVSCFWVNLRGHGSLVAGSMVEDFYDLPYRPRPQPEIQF